MKLLAIVLLVLLVVPLASCALPDFLSSKVPETPSVSMEDGTSSPSSTPSSALPSSEDCPHRPLGGFYDVWRDEQVWPRLGCAVAPAEAVAGTEAYLCDNTHSLWLRERQLFVVIRGWPASWAFVPDESGLPPDSSLMEAPWPSSQPCFPASGRHGWLARALSPETAAGLQARTSETAFSGAIQQFEGGWLLWNGDVCFVLFADGTWTMF
jgi:hypothetical protein